MKAATLTPGTTITTTNFYTDRRRSYVVRSVSKSARQIVVDRPDWATGKMILTYRPSRGLYCNDYANEVYRVKSA